MKMNRIRLPLFLFCLLTACGDTGFVTTDANGAGNGDGESPTCTDRELLCAETNSCERFTCALNVTTGPIVGSFDDTSCGVPIECAVTVDLTAPVPNIRTAFQNDKIGHGQVMLRMKDFDLMAARHDVHFRWELEADELKSGFYVTGDSGPDPVNSIMNNHVDAPSGFGPGAVVTVWLGSRIGERIGNQPWEKRDFSAEVRFVMP